MRHRVLKEDSEITGRRRGELVRGVFSILLDHPDGLSAFKQTTFLDVLTRDVTKN